MRSRKKRILALLLALTMLAGDASLAYAAEEPGAETVTEEETAQEQTEQEEAEESAGPKEQEKTVGEQAGQEAADSDADEGAETELAAPQTEEAADTAGEAETAESVQMADAVSGEYTYTSKSQRIAHDEASTEFDLSGERLTGITGIVPVYTVSTEYTVYRTITDYDRYTEGPDGTRLYYEYSQTVTSTKETDRKLAYRYTIEFTISYID